MQYPLISEYPDFDIFFNSGKVISDFQTVS